jgi:hypothetical protein
MIDILNSYLILHKSISIPGLGTIYVERVPANSDFVNRQILPPGYQFRFDKYSMLLIKSSSATSPLKNILPILKPSVCITNGPYELRNQLKGEEPVEWKGIGKLHQDANGEIHFHPQKSERIPMKPVAAQRVVRNNTAHTMLVGDKETTTLAMSEMLTEVTSIKKRWWIYALIIAVIAAAILIYRFSRDGFTPDATETVNMLVILIDTLK